MRVRLLKIEVPADRPTGPSAKFEVRVLVEIEGVQSWHSIEACPRDLDGNDVIFLTATGELDNALRREQRALHRIYKVVGQQLRGHDAGVPRLVAA